MKDGHLDDGQNGSGGRRSGVWKGILKSEEFDGTEMRQVSGLDWSKKFLKSM